jgi:hypothetical protein
MGRVRLLYGGKVGWWANLSTLSTIGGFATRPVV